LLFDAVLFGSFNEMPDPSAPESATPIFADAQLSEARQEAFKIFQRDHPEMGHVTDQKQLLKRRFVEAKSLGQELNNSRNEISESFVIFDLYRELCDELTNSQRKGSPSTAY